MLFVAMKRALEMVHRAFVTDCHTHGKTPKTHNRQNRPGVSSCDCPGSCKTVRACPDRRSGSSANTSKTRDKGDEDSGESTDSDTDSDDSGDAGGSEVENREDGDEDDGEFRRPRRRSKTSK